MEQFEASAAANSSFPLSETEDGSAVVRLAARENCTVARGVLSAEPCVVSDSMPPMATLCAQKKHPVRATQDAQPEAQARGLNENQRGERAHGRQPKRLHARMHAAAAGKTHPSRASGASPVGRTARSSTSFRAVTAARASDAFRRPPRPSVLHDRQCASRQRMNPEVKSGRRSNAATARRQATGNVQCGNRCRGRVGRALRERERAAVRDAEAAERDRRRGRHLGVEQLDRRCERTTTNTRAARSER